MLVTLHIVTIIRLTTKQGVTDIYSGSCRDEITPQSKFETATTIPVKQFLFFVYGIRELQ